MRLIQENPMTRELLDALLRILGVRFEECLEGVVESLKLSLASTYRRRIAPRSASPLSPVILNKRTTFTELPLKELQRGDTQTLDKVAQKFARALHAALWDKLGAPKSTSAREHPLTFEAILETAISEHLHPLMTPHAGFLENLRSSLRKLFEEMLVLRPLNYAAIREPAEPKGERQLADDARNLVSFLYNLYLRDHDAWNELCELLNTYFFPDITLAFKLTESGRIMLTVYEKDKEIPPPNIPEGLFKVLAILAALVTEPPLIVIDEIENSLHPNFVETILDLLRASDATVIVTTHSPAVVDAAKLEEIVVVERGPEGSKFTRIPEPEKVKQWLRKTHAEVSHYVFYR